MELPTQLPMTRSTNLVKDTKCEERKEPHNRSLSKGRPFIRKKMLKIKVALMQRE